jgi:tRNA A-37 threonylcarbamoyl transferase component Bud32
MRVCSKCQLKYRDGRERCILDGAPIVEVRDPRIGTVLDGRYVIEDVIGEGGMATVYRARHTLMQRPLAVKVLRRDLSVDPTQRERLVREGRASAVLTHPNIIEVYDIGETDDGCPYLVMELLQGKPLRGVLDDAGGPLETADVVDIGVQIGRGLARAHDFGIVHRDLKPENVFVVEEAGRRVVKLVDFGIARSRQDEHLTAMGEVIGTPQYLAPERATQRDVEASSDLYSFGVMLFEMAVGHLPFQASNIPSYVLKHLHEAPPRPRETRPEIPEALETLILELLAKRPERRPVDAHQVVERLLAVDPVGHTVRPSAPRLAAGAEQADRSALEGWRHRLSRFEEEAARSEPHPEVEEALGRFRHALAGVDGLHQEGVRQQRVLDALEREQRERGERLGHAVHVLGQDLSRAREEERQAEAEREGSIARRDRRRHTFQEVHEALEALHPGEHEHPEPHLLERAREVLAAAESWTRADRRAEVVARAFEAKHREVADLDYQVDALRSQLARLELDVQQRGKDARARLAALGLEAQRFEGELVGQADRLSQLLRSAPTPDSFEITRQMDDPVLD